MKFTRRITGVIGAVLWAAVWTASALAATNQATDPGGGGVTLTGSGTVTVNSAALQLVKQVWDSTGANCLASIPADATCNASATTVTVPVGTQLTFLIFVRNTTAVAVTDMRFQDLLDDSAAGFTYVAASLKRTPNDGTAPSDVAALATIMAAAATAQTDALGGPDDFMSITDSDADTLLDKLTVGAVAGQANTSLGFPANKTFGVVFQASKN